MKINKNNYEAFFLDYHEGNLVPLETVELFLFIEQHPELKEEFEGFENFTIDEIPPAAFENKSILKKEITLDNKDEYFIKSVENTLNIDEKHLLDNFLLQYPQFSSEFDMFQKTKIHFDASVVFDNKNGLKRAIAAERFEIPLSNCSSNITFPSADDIIVKKADVIDEMLISSIEGLLTSEETKLLNQQILSDLQINIEFGLYQQTKLSADISIVFADKEKLKRKYKSTVPLFYFISIAASILLLFGAFFLFIYNEVKPKYSYIPTIIKNTAPINYEKAASIEKPAKTGISQPIKLNSFTQIKVKPTGENLRSHNSSEIIQNEKHERLITFERENKQLLVSISDPVFIVPHSIEMPDGNLNITAIAKNNTETLKPAEFLSIKELASEKIKEKLLDNNTLAEQKKSGRLKKIGGWDIAQIITNGISKLTGRHLKVEPYYNEEGTVTAYALSAGEFQISKGR